MIDDSNRSEEIDSIEIDSIDDGQKDRRGGDVRSFVRSPD